MSGSRKKVIIIVAVIIIAVLTGALGFSVSPSRRIEKKLELGEKYLTELNYEQAIATFKEALEIAPGDENILSHIKGAYKSWSDALVVDGAYENAVARLDEARLLFPEDWELIDSESDIYISWALYFADTVKDLDRAMEILNEGYEKLGTKSISDAISKMEQRVIVRNMSRPLRVKASISFTDISEIRDRLIAQTGDEFIGIQSYSYVIRFEEPIAFRVREENGEFGEEVTLTEAIATFGNADITHKYFSTDEYSNPLPGNLLDQTIEVEIDPYVRVASDYEGEPVTDTREMVMGHTTFRVFPNGFYESRVSSIIGYE